MKNGKFKIYNLKTNQEVIDFAINDISESLYYIDSDGESWTGSDLKKCILNSSYDYDVFFGEIKEIEPYSFFYVESQNVTYDIKRYNSSILYDGDSWEWGRSDNELEAFSLMFGCWEHFTSREKNKAIVSVYKCFGIPEHMEFLNAADLIGFAAKHKGREYISQSSEVPNVIFRIDSILNQELNTEKIIEDDNNLYYQDSIDDVIFRVRIKENQFKLFGDLELEDTIEILESK